MKNVRAAIGVRLLELDAVVVTVAGDTIGTYTIDLTRKPSGRGEHVAFRCPSCLEPRSVLYVNKAALACAICARYRTRHQRESWSKEWEDHGHELEDRLFRTLMKCETLSGLQRLSTLVDDLVEGDLDRLSAALELTSAALAFTDTEGRSSFAEGQSTAETRTNSRPSSTQTSTQD